MAVVTGIDILGVQEYVFTSNQLRDMLAASWMVNKVLNPDSLMRWSMTNERILLAAGGNAILEFDTEEAAKTWTGHYTRWLQDKAPGLEVVVAHRSYDGHSLAWGLKALAVDLARAKLERRPSAPQLGLSVTAACAVTGLPASSLDESEHVPISPRIEILRHSDTQRSAKERWDQYLPKRLNNAPEWRAEFPLEFDLLGRTRGDTSLLGVVHVDGNGVGKALNRWIERCLDERVDDATVRTQCREWSRAIEKLAERVLDATVQRVSCCVSSEDGGERCILRGTPQELAFSLRDWRDDKTRKTVFLPFRPILLGGDDLTFVCDGRIALDLAVTALRAFEARQIPYLGENGEELTLTACAGVALVKAHAPFRNSYALAESLCSSAKRARLEASQHAHTDGGCWLDWHIGSARPADTVDDIRRREYQGGELTMRPYPLAPMGHHKSWDWLDKELLGPGSTPQTAEHGFRGATCWVGSRNRVRRLGSLVSAGKDSVTRQVDAWNAIEPEIQLPGSVPPGGFIGRRTPLLDAIEFMDLHIRLEPDSRLEGTLAREEDI